MKGILKALIGLVVLIAAAALVWAVWRHESRSKAAQSPRSVEEPTVVVQRIEAAPLVLTRTYIGTVIPIHSVNILPFISGFVDEVRVSGGQSVQAGDVLFVLQQDEYKAALDARYAAILQAAATYTNAETYYNRMKQAGA